MPARVSAGLAGRSRRLPAGRGSWCHGLIITNMFVKNKFATNMFVEAAARALPATLHPIAADDILMTNYQVRPTSAARTA